MSTSRRQTGVIMVAPGKGSQGGITIAVQNLASTPFWSEFRCVDYASTADSESRVLKLLSDVLRWLRFSVTLITGRRPWVVSIHTAHDASFYRKFAYMVTCAILRVPTVLHIHPASFADFYVEGSIIRRLIIKTAGRMADQIVVLSKTIRRSLAPVFPAHKMRMLMNPVNIPRYRPPSGNQRTSRPRVLFLGWIIREKGVYDLADAIPEVLQAIPDAIFCFAGNKEIEQLRSLLARRGLAGSTEVLGWVDGQRKLELLQTSWVLVLPSYREGVPNVILEAMASRLPIVTTPVGGIPDVLEDGRTALFIKPRSAPSIARSLKRILRDNELREKLASEAFNEAQEHYSLEEADRVLRDLYARYRPPMKAAQRELQ